jgi:hypothetical protein
MRAMMSVDPPGGYATITRIGLFGKLSAPRASVAATRQFKRPANTQAWI